MTPLRTLLAVGSSIAGGLDRNRDLMVDKPFSAIPTLPAHILSFLSTLASSLLDSDHDPGQLLIAYVGIRAPYLQKCMEAPLARAEDRGSREGYTKGSGGVVLAGKAVLRMTKV